MVAKITYGSSIFGAVSYNHMKVLKGTASVLYMHNMINRLDDAAEPKIPEILRSFEDYLYLNPRVKLPVAHFSLNPSPEDKLPDETLTEITDSYMDKMGYKDQPYIVYKHQDIDREHIHIVSVRIKENGERISDSYDYERSVKACRELETDYGLKQIADVSKEESVYYLKKIEYGRSDLKSQISNTIKTLVKDYDFQTLGEFNALLSCFNIHSREVKGEEAGNLYHGIVYSAMNKEGEVVGPPIKSSRIGQFAGYKSLAIKMTETIQSVKSKGFHAPYAKSKITSAMKASSSIEQLASLLKSKNMDVIFRQNAEGRIYGVTFIDYANKIAFNGSRLGKEFSANAFNNLFTNKVATSLQNKNSAPALFNELELQQNNGISTSTDVDEIFGTFYLNINSIDQEELFIRKLNRKKNKSKK